MNRHEFSNQNVAPRKHRYVLAAIGLFWAGLAHTAQAAEPDWSAYGQLLERYLSRRSEAGIELAWLDYSALRQDPAFPRVVEQIAVFPAENPDRAGALAGQEHQGRREPLAAGMAAPGGSSERQTDEPG